MQSYMLEELHLRDMLAWSALIVGYAQQGQAHEALKCLKHRESESISPDSITLVCVMSACGHIGLVNDAKMLFQIMTTKYCISPNLEHLNCMVVVFGCGGQFDKAISMIKAMPFFEYSAIGISLLGACRKWGNVKLGRLSFDQAIQLDNNGVATYVLMANTYAAAGMQEDAEMVEAMRLRYVA